MKKVSKDIQLEVDKELSRLLGFVDEKSIVTIDQARGIVFIGGQRIDEARLANLKAESEMLLNSELWKLLSETIRHMAYEQIFVKSKDYSEIVSGKMWLYHLDVQKKLMDVFKSYKKQMPPPVFNK